MEKTLLILFFFLTSLFGFSQEVLHLQTEYACLGKKRPSEQYYKWGDLNKARIKIDISDTKVIVFAEATYIIHIIRNISKDDSESIFLGKDDEGVQCHVRIGYDSDADRPYLSVDYANLAFFYFME